MVDRKETHESYCKKREYICIGLSQNTANFCRSFGKSASQKEILC